MRAAGRRLRSAEGEARTGKLLTVDNQIDPRPARSSSRRSSPTTTTRCSRTSSSTCGCTSRRCETRRSSRRRRSSAGARHVRLRRQGRQHGDRAAGEARPGRRRARRRSPRALTAGERVVVDGTDKADARASTSRSSARAAAPGRNAGGAGGPRRRGARKGTAPMNLSRLFILRPVATSLLMVAVLLGGHRRLPRAAALGAAGGRLPDDPGRHALSGREPGRDDVVDHRAARAPVRADAGAEPDVVDELRRRVGDHAAVQPRPVARRRRAGSAGGDQRRRQPAADRPAAAADLQQGQSGRHADPDAGASRRRRCRCRRCRTWSTRGSRRRSRSCPASAWSASAAASGRPCASRPIRRRSPRTASTSTTCARRSPHANVNQAKGSFDGPTRASTIDANDQLRSRRRIPGADHRLQQRRAGARCPTSPTSSTAPRTRGSPRGPNDAPAVILNIQRQPGANVIEVVDRVKRCCRSCRRRCPPRSTSPC